MRQVDVARASGFSRAAVSLIERGHCEALSLRSLERIAATLDVRIDVAARWRGGDCERLLNAAHSMLANAFARRIASFPAWVSEPEASFPIYGERGVIDRLAWHRPTGHLLLVELKTQLVDVNELLGTLDRKVRLARAVGRERGWQASSVSEWLIVLDSRTNWRHVAAHEHLLRSRFTADGRQLRAFLSRPSGPTRGLAFWTDANAGSVRLGAAAGSARIRVARRVENAR
jgi:transcriptional regulator with XRE-family HTH domain